MAMGRRMSQRDNRAPQIRINHRIRVSEVRVVLEDGTMLGVLSTQDALREAKGRGLDLVEVNPKASPPVCKILDFGKFKYEEKKRAREAKKKQAVVEVKEIKLRPKTDDHDLNVKLRAARRFMESGNKVKVTVRFRGREITHPERATMQLDWLIERVEDIAVVEQRPTMEARAMSILLAPRPAVLLKLAQERARAAEANEALGTDAAPDDDHDLDDDDDDDIDDDQDDDDGDDDGGDGDGDDDGKDD
jgi:translation initiation factor IF-3